MNNIIEIKKFIRNDNEVVYTLYKEGNGIYNYTVDQIYTNHHGTKVRRVQEVFAGTILQNAKDNFNIKIKALKKRGYILLEE